MVHPILSHTALLVIGLIAMGMIVSSLSSSFSKTERNLVTVEADYIAESAKGKILEIYSLVEQSDYSSGTFQLNLPERIGDKKYIILLDQNLLTLRVPFENDVIEVNKTMNIPADISGESTMPASVTVEKDGAITMELV
jgi:hypothetical protein